MKSGYQPQSGEPPDAPKSGSGVSPPNVGSGGKPPAHFTLKELVDAGLIGNAWSCACEPEKKRVCTAVGCPWAKVMADRERPGPLTMQQHLAVVEIERLLLTLLKGEHSSLTISFNDANGPSYMSVGGSIAQGDYDHSDWISDEEKAKAIDTNRWWTIHWYPHTPVGFQAISGASLSAVVEAALREEQS